MAPTYKLSYFEFMALGEPIRYLLTYGKINFEDERIKRENWPNLKNQAPFGKMPILEIDGKKYHQSISICRYLSKKIGLAGADDLQNYKIDSTVDTIVDLRVETYKIAFEGDESSKEEKKNTFLKETFPFYMKKLDEQVKENGGYFVDKKLTWADLHFSATVESINGALKIDAVADYSNLKTLVEKVWALPEIKAYRAKRPSAPL